MGTIRAHKAEETMKTLLLILLLALVTNNGGLCKSQDPALEVEKRGVDCPSGWMEGGGKCIHWNLQQRLTWYDANDYCRAHDAELLSWRSEGEYLTFKFFWLELGVVNEPIDIKSWTGGIQQSWNWGDWTWGNLTNDLVPMNYGWAEGEPNNMNDNYEQCGELYERGRGELNDCNCEESRPFICQLNGYDP